MDGEFLDEDNGATLYCDTCQQQVRSNEAHRCQGFEAVPLCDPRLLECLRKVKRALDEAEFALRHPDTPKVESPEPGDTLGGDSHNSEVATFTVLARLDLELNEGVDAEDLLSEMDYDFAACPAHGTIRRHEIVSWQRR